MNAVKHSGGCLGVPSPKCVAVALSAASPRFAAGFPLQSLTRNAILLLVSFFLLPLQSFKASNYPPVMGWKVSAVVVGTKYDKPLTQLTMDLGLGGSTIDGELTLMEALYSDELCIGFFDSCTIITHRSILMDFFDAEPSKMETAFSQLFSRSQLVVAGQYENGGISGFSIITNGKRERTRLEGEEEGSIRDVGKPLPEEKGNSVYDLTFSLPSKLLGERLDSERVLSTKMFRLKRK